MGGPMRERGHIPGLRETILGAITAVIDLTPRGAGETADHILVAVVARGFRWMKEREYDSLLQVMAKLERSDQEVGRLTLKVSEQRGSIEKLRDEDDHDARTTIAEDLGYYREDEGHCPHCGN